MCGICGAAALSGSLDPASRQGVRSMAADMAYRGPDGDGFFDSDRISLGHRRLAIIDRAGGAQPMANEDESCWIVFNGEVYNHRDLRPVLESRGHVFRTRSDTETILHAWEEYGTECVEHLEGMFTFAIADTRRNELFVARDRLGKKPLFYTMLNGVVHFASELSALSKAAGWRGDLQLDAIEGYLSLGYFLSPDSIYRGVYKLPPAHWLHVAGGRLITRRYWDVTEFGTDQRDEPELLDAVDAALGTAVRDRLESEVPLGAFLSGGLDSGLVVSYMADALGERLLTNTVGFGDAAHNELDAARITADAFHTAHHEETLDARSRRGVPVRRRSPRRADGRLVGDPDVVRLAQRQTERHRGVDRRRRRRDVCRVRLPLRAARARREGTSLRARRAGPGAGRRRRTRVAALAGAAQVAACRHGAGEPRPTTPRLPTTPICAS